MPLPAPPRPRRHPCRGLTLTELLVVVVMVGILTGIGASKLDWRRYRADSVSRGVMAELAAAQRLAVSLQADVRITQPSTNRLAIHEDANNDGAVGASERVRMVVLEDGYAFQKVTASDVPSPSDPTQLTAVIFRRDGSASRSGTFYVEATAADPDCRRCRAVSVTRATGRVVWFSKSQGIWRRAN